MNWKRFIAKLLIVVAIFTSVDLSYVDLSGTGKVLAAATDVSLDAVTDAYLAWDELHSRWQAIANQGYSSNSIADQMDLETISGTSYNSMAAANVQNSTWTNTAQHVINGLYTFNQQNIKTTAQIKSGRWFDDTTYEAMQGTPTTEPLFVTFGGSQWLVDLQYKFIKSPYERTYTFLAYTPNYRYYRVNANKKSSDVTVDYTAVLSAKFYEDPNELAKYTVNIENNITGASTLYNYAYVWFEAGDEHKYNDPEAVLSASITNITNERKTFKVYKADGWADASGEFVKDKIAPWDKNVDGTFTQADLSSSEYVSPNVARAIMVKKEIWNLLTEYEKAWQGQDDNYRVDQGAYDIDKIHIDSSKDLNDELSFMYTYGSMVRHGTVLGRDHATQGNKFYSDSIWYPSIVSYLYDWSSYYLHDRMTTSYGSTTPNVPRVKDLGFSKNSFYNSIANSLATEGASKGTNGTNPKTNANVAFPLYYEDLAMYQFVRHDNFTVAENAPVSLECAEEVAKLVGSDVCIAISDFDNLFAFGSYVTTTSGDPGSPLERGEHYSVSHLSGEWDSGLKRSQYYIEGATLYYRAIYSILLNYGCFFYYDEMQQLMESLGKVYDPSGHFQGSIGFPNPNMSSEDYNRHVNACLAAYFGQGQYFKSDQVTYLPLAIFPLGGDLDGPMDNEQIYNNGLYYLNSVAGSQPIENVLSPGLVKPTYVYNVSFTVHDVIPSSNKLNVTSGTYYYYKHNEETSRQGHLLCDDSEVHPNCNGTWDSASGTCLQAAITCSVGGTHIDRTTTNGVDSFTTKTCGEPTHCAGRSWTKTTSGSTVTWTCGACGYKTSANCNATLNPAEYWKANKSVYTGQAQTRYSHVPPHNSNCPGCSGNKGVRKPCNAISAVNASYHPHYGYNNEKNVPIGSHENRAVKYEYAITTSSKLESGANGVNNTGTPSEWSYIKSLSYGDEFKQTFANVQWLEIQDYAIWQIDHGSLTGTTKLLCGSSDIDNAENVLANQIITKAVDQLGYTVFRQNSRELHSFYDPPTTNSYTNGTIWIGASTKTASFLESKGIVQNSFKIGSLGETDSDELEVPMTDSTNNSQFGTVTKYPYLRYINKHDTPKILIDGALINDDSCAFSILYSDDFTSDSDSVILTYRPMSQGGRSHTTFPGFINQALAHTLYWADTILSTKSYTAAMDKMSYSNSLRIQGDYLTLDETNGDELTLVGMYYNTWDERGTSYEYAGGKFALAPAGFNELSIYDSSCLWIPARMSLMLARSNREAILGGINCIVDCWTIHSYCVDINGGKHTNWDMITDSGVSLIAEGAKCEGYACASSVTAATGNLTDKGCINPNCGELSNITVTHTTSGLKSPMNDYYYRRAETQKFNTGSIITFTNLFNNNAGFYNKFTYADCNGNTIGKAVTISPYSSTLLTYPTSINVNSFGYGGCVDIQINLNWYLAQNMNKENIMTSSVLSTQTTSVEKGMPYIGYHGTKDGIHDITLTASSNTQKGYTSGPVTLFDKEKAFVSQASQSSQKGFWRFDTDYVVGSTGQSNAIPETCVSGKSNNNSYTTHVFSKNYPWLSGLNVNRYLPNNFYNTGRGTVHYSKMGSWQNDFYAEEYPAYQSTPWNENEKKFNTYYEMNNNNTGGATNGSNVNNGGAGGYLNGIVIYNPTSVQSAHVVTPSEDLPDAANKEFTLSGSDILMGYVKRDTRLAYKYQFDESAHGEQYMAGGGILTRKIKTSDYTRWAPKDVSDIVTIGYTDSDYEVNIFNKTPWFTADMDGSYTVKETGTYNMTKFVNTKHYTSATVDLIEGDTVKFAANGNAVVVSMGTNNFDLEWSAFTDAYKALQTTTDNEAVKEWTAAQMTSGLPLFSNMGITIGLGANMQLRAGSLIKIALTVSDTYEEGHSVIDDALELNADSLTSITVHSHTRSVDPDADRVTYEWFLEATDLTYISGLTFNVKKDCFLWRSENIWTNEDVVLMCISSDGNDTSIMDVTSYGFFYEGQGWDVTTMTTRNFYNNTIVDIRGEWQIQGVAEMTVAGFYMCGESSLSSIKLKSEALNNPHKVANTDWRYYVLGWSTPDGYIITSPVDDKLFNSSTILYAPSGIQVTVGELRSLIYKGGGNVALGIYLSQSGEFGLIDVGVNSDITSRESRYTGLKITTGTFQMIQFDNDDITEHAGKAFVAKNPFSTYGLNPITNAEKRRHSFECVFYATDGKNAAEVLSTSNYAYDVSFSWYIGHRWDITSNKDLVVQDWDEELVPVYAFSQEDYNAVFASTLSLDDEYTIYWDNYSDLIPSGTGITNGYLALASTSLGRGWDKLLANDNVKNTDYWSTYFNSKTAIDPENTDTTLTDTTKWIYSKYVVFNVDMYAFTTGSSFVYNDLTALANPNWDPTTPAYKDNGTPNNIVYIPAGQRVHLGKYTGVGEGPCDDEGHFIDFGTGKNYTYHFWIPLSDGESDDNVVATFCVNGINGVQNTQNNDCSSAVGKSIHFREGINPTTYTAVKSGSMYPRPVALQRLTTVDGQPQPVVDEWGKEVLNGEGIIMDNNVLGISRVRVDNMTSIVTEKSVTYTRPNNAFTTQVMSIVGRVGGLTVVDTGDPRYQDTFKKAKVDASWAISPIVKLIEKFSNVKGEEGSQKKYLTDLIDIRGRWLTKLDSSINYTVSKSSDSYAEASWFRRMTSVNERVFLPLTSEFNDHEEIKNSVATAKLGYETYCSLDTTGNYYGSSKKRPSMSDEDYVNNNLDYGQSKVQVHPMYVGLDTETGEWFPVDVYMRKGSSYALINAGSSYADAESAGSHDSGPYYLDSCWNATYTSSIETNSGGIINNAYVLDQGILRRSITEEESSITYDVVHDIVLDDNSDNISLSSGITTSLLDSNDYNSGGIGGSGLDYKYVYGNAQMLFLREFNRTFYGGTTLAVNQKVTGSSDVFIRAMLRNAEKYAQRWYFGLGLPSSAVFVPHGQKPTESTIINGKSGYFVLTLIDVYAIGEKWALHYESPVSGQQITIDNIPYSSDKWNVYKDQLPYVIPVNIYDMSDSTAAGDLDTRGSH